MTVDWRPELELAIGRYRNALLRRKDYTSPYITPGDLPETILRYRASIVQARLDGSIDEGDCAVLAKMLDDIERDEVMRP